MKYLGIDIGSTTLKSAILDLEACEILQVRKLSAPIRIHDENPHIFQIRAEDYFQTVKGLIDEAAAVFQDLEGVVFSTQMHGFVLGERYISWQDTRCLDTAKKGKSYLEILEERISPERMQECGVYLKPSLGLCNLYAKWREEKIRGGKIYTLGSYLIARLTGENICHISNAAPLGFVNLKRREWDVELLEHIGMNNFRLPRISENDWEPCGVYRVGERAIKIYPDYGDQQISILGSGAEKTDAVINIATASQVAVFSRNFEFGPYETRPYFGKEYIKVISNMPAGRNLDVLVNFIRHVAERIAGQTFEEKFVRERIDTSFRLETGNLEVNTAFYPVPGWYSGGEIRHIDFENFTVDHLFTAAYEDMARKYWENLGVLCDREKIGKIVCAGGVSWKNPYLLQMISYISGWECQRSRYPDEALAGLFRAAMRCAGREENFT